jgi:hypothetical protein
MPFGRTTVLSHSGASPGGVAVLAVVPEYDLAFAAFGNDPRAMRSMTRFCSGSFVSTLRSRFQISCRTCTRYAISLPTWARTARINFVDLSVVDGQLEEKLAYEPLDDVQERIFTRFAGGSFPVPPRRLYPLARTSSRRSGCRCRHSTVIRANFSSHSMVSANAVRKGGFS